MQTILARARLGALAFGFSLLASCSDSSTGNSGDSLTQAEVEVLVAQLVIRFGGGFSPLSSGPELSSTVDDVFECPLGGGFEKVGSLLGTVDEEAQTAQFSVDFRQHFFNCGFPGPGGVLRFTGDPGPRVLLEFTQDTPLTTYDFRVRGDLDFETFDGRVGHCAIDLVVDITLELNTPGGAVVDVGGSACRVRGADIQLDV